MVFDPTLHHRRSIRLRTHDAATGGRYDVASCAADNVVIGQLNPEGMLARLLADGLFSKPIAMPSS
jgi:hypothetical protein